MLCVVLIYSDKIKRIFRSWQQRSAVCFGVASAKGNNTTIYYCIVFIPSKIKSIMEENEWTFAQINTFLESNMLFFFRERKFDWNVLATKKILAQNCQTSPLPQTMNNFVPFVNFTFFYVWQLFRGRMPCSYIKKQLRRNSLQLQSFDAFCRLNGLRW